MKATFHFKDGGSVEWPIPGSSFLGSSLPSGWWYGPDRPTGETIRINLNEVQYITVTK